MTLLDPLLRRLQFAQYLPWTWTRVTVRPLPLSPPTLSHPSFGEEYAKPFRRWDRDHERHLRSDPGRSETRVDDEGEKRWRGRRRKGSDPPSLVPHLSVLGLETSLRVFLPLLSHPVLGSRVHSPVRTGPPCLYPLGGQSPIAKGPHSTFTPHLSSLPLPVSIPLLSVTRPRPDLWTRGPVPLDGTSKEREENGKRGKSSLQHPYKCCQKFLRTPTLHPFLSLVNNSLSHPVPGPLESNEVVSEGFSAHTGSTAHFPL